MTEENKVCEKCEIELTDEVESIRIPYAVGQLSGKTFCKSCYKEAEAIENKHYKRKNDEIKKWLSDKKKKVLPKPPSKKKKQFSKQVNLVNSQGNVTGTAFQLEE